MALLSSVQRFHMQQTEQQRNALRLVNMMEASHRELLSEASTLLTAVSRLSVTANLASAQCPATLRELTQNLPRFQSFGLAAPNGDVYCSSKPVKLKTNIAQMPFFNEVMATQMAAAGPYEMVPQRNQPLVYLGAPLMNDAQQVSAVLFATFDLSGFENWLSVLRLPSDSVIVMFDQRGLILARHPDADRWAGSVRPQAPLLDYVNAHGDAGAVDLMGASGIERLFAYATIHKTAEQTVFLALGIATDSAYASARQAYQSELLSMALACFMVLGIAWIGSDVLIVNKLRLLIHAANRIRHGDLQVRSGLKPGTDEAAQLGGAIDSMAQAIESRVAALQQHGLELRQLRDMNDALQACVGSDEVYAMVRQSIQQLFPGRAGALYMLDADEQHFCAVARWLEPASAAEFLQNDCWAVRRGKTFRVDARARRRPDPLQPRAGATAVQLPVRAAAGAGRSDRRLAPGK